MIGSLLMNRYLSLLVLPVALAGCEKAETPATKPDLATVTVGTVAMRPLTGAVAASGQLVSREEAAVAPELPGYRVARVFVEEDARVHAGQPLAVLDDALLRPQIDQAAATLAQQQVAAERSSAEAERVKGLDDKGVLSNEAIAERRLAARTGTAQVAVARAQLRDLQVRRGRLIVRSPVDGRVLERAVRPGDTSQIGTIMFRIGRDDLVELDAEVSEAQANTIRPGDAVSVTLASGANVSGKVRLIGARVDPQTGLIRVRIALPKRKDLRPGGFAQAAFGATGRPTQTVPEAAIRYGAGGSTIQMVDARNTVHARPVRTGRRGGGLVEIIDGPPEGTRVVLGGGSFVLEGDTVRPVRSSAR